MPIPVFPTSLPDFQQTFGTEGACLKYLEDVRWPNGFVCWKCGVKAEPERIRTRSRVLRCASCKTETRTTAGTILQDTRTPICTWFWGAYLATTQTPGQSALQFQRQLGIKRYETAFQMLHKLRAAMIRPGRDRIGGKYPVEVDEVLIGGKTKGEGRGKHHKTLVAGALEVRTARSKQRDPWDTGAGVPLPGNKYAGRLRLAVVSDRSKSALESFVEDNVETGTRITTDGWQGYDNLEQRGFKHTPIIVRGDPEMLEQHLPTIHIVFSNLKTWILGTHRGVSPKHLQAYLNEYAFRFNRRFYPFNAFNSVLGIGVRVASPTYKQLYSGEWSHPLNGLE